MARETKEGIYKGIIERDEKGNYFCGPYLLDFKMVEAQFKVGDKVSLKKVIANNSRISVDAYPQKSIKFFLAGEDHDNESSYSN